MKLVYRIIYTPWVNFILRNFFKLISPIFKIKLPPAGTFTFRLSSGKSIKFATNQTDPVAQKIYWQGLYQYEYVEMFEKLISNCSSFVDVGSNAGLYSLIAAGVNDDIQVVAFDPTNASAHYFTKNVKLNHFENQITFVQEAITGEEGEISFYEVRNHKYPWLKNNLGGASSARNKPKEFEEVKVKTNSLLGALTKVNKEDLKIDLIKVDAEGVEPEIIKGMPKIIERDKPIIVCEMLFDQNHNEDELQSIFREKGYEFYPYVPGRGLVLMTDLHREADNSVRDCFFVHPSKLDLIKPYLAQ